MSMTANAHFYCQPNSHPFQERHVPLNEPTKIGRSVARCRPSPNNAVFDCKVLSRNHALLWFENGKFYLQDTKSSNGTFVNNQRLSKASEESPAIEVNSYDVVQFGVDVVDSMRKVTHGCIVSQLRLYLPNGEESQQRNSTWNNQLLEKIPFSNTYCSLQSQDLYQLHHYLQEALHREQMLEQKLALLQRLLVNSQDASEKGWQALIDEDRLLSRLEFVENQLQSSNKTQSEDGLQNQLQILQEEKYNYENTSKETLRQALQEKLEVVRKLANMERSLSNTEDECSHVHNINEQTRNEIINLAASHQEKVQELEDVTLKLQESERKCAEITNSFESQRSELEKQFEEYKNEQKKSYESILLLEDDNKRLKEENELHQAKSDAVKTDTGVQADVSEPLDVDIKQTEITPDTSNQEVLSVDEVLGELDDIVDSTDADDEQSDSPHQMDEKVKSLLLKITQLENERENEKKDKEILKEKISAYENEKEDLLAQLQAAESRKIEPDLPQKSDSAQQSDLPQKSDFAQQSDLPQKSDSAQQSDLPQKSDSAQQSDLPQKSDSAQQSDLPQKSDSAQQSDLVQAPDYWDRAASMFDEDADQFTSMIDDEETSSESYLLFKRKLQELKSKFTDSEKKLKVMQEDNNKLQEQIEENQRNSSSAETTENIAVCELLANGDAPNTDKSSSNDTEEKLQEELNTAKLRILDQEKQLNSLQEQLLVVQDTANRVTQLESELSTSHDLIRDLKMKSDELECQAAEADRIITTLRNTQLSLQEKLSDEENVRDKNKLLIEELQKTCNDQSLEIAASKQQEQEAILKLNSALEELSQKQTQFSSLEQQLNVCVQQKSESELKFTSLNQTMVELEKEKTTVTKELNEIKEKQTANEVSLEEQVKTNQSLQESLDEKHKKWEKELFVKDEQLAEAIAKCQQLIQKREEKQRAADRNPRKKWFLLFIFGIIVAFLYYCLFPFPVSYRPF